MAAAALRVIAVIASSGVIPSIEQPSAAVNWRFPVGEEPGLKSDASATAQPASIMARASGLEASRRKRLVVGSSTGTTPALASARIPVRPVPPRCSADVAFSRAASAAPPPSPNSSAWIFVARPAAFAARRTFALSAFVKAPVSQKTSQKTASFCFATAGIITSVTRRT